ncbi:MAG: iron ABC transporter ATP-binding protein [Hyphomicrobiales bacterium]|nr:ABC transporter ATP-binding protein [Hyphomicrobiales bacterium]PCH50688.1 MAG: iron ABC transporter ATP-binding protein [Hyphomicrobiales bacterium]
MSFSVKNLNAGYDRKMILNDVNFSNIKNGQLVGLIGPNAAGKSTLFKTITGLLKPKQGSVVLNDVDLTQEKREARARRVAYMPQIFGCNAFLSVFESVLLALKQSSGWRVKANDIAQVEKTLSDLGLSHLSGRGLSQLSGGQAQMVAVARTLVREPELVLLDEPTSALDLHHQLSIMTAVRNAVTNKNIIGMIALHDLNLGAKFCDRLILIREGKVLADDVPEKVLSMPELNDTYRVETSLEYTKSGAMFIDAQLGNAYL